MSTEVSQGVLAVPGSDIEVERRARAAWSRLAEPGDADAWTLITRLGHVEALAAVQAGAPVRTAGGTEMGPGAHTGVAARAGVSGTERYAARLRTLDVDRDLAWAQRFGTRVVIPGDPDWPQGLDNLPGPPHCLWVRGGGGLATAQGHGVAVVGARACTSYGVSVARRMGAELADRGYVVVSGAAFGIDAAAHRGALQAEGITVAVLACGVDRSYPVAHADLLKEITQRGAVIAEVPPGSSPMRRRFLERNRLIAAMTVGTVVVEAGLRSGSLNTARSASELGRVVAAVPGPVTSMLSAGCHLAIRDGMALLVTDAAEVVDAVGVLGVDAVPRPSGPVAAYDVLDAEDQLVWGAMPARRAATIASLAAAAGRSEGEVRAALGRLDLFGFARREGTGWKRLSGPA